MFFGNPTNTQSVVFTPTHTSAKTGLMTTTQDTQTTIEPIYSSRGVTAYAVAGPDTPTSIWQIQKTRDGYHVFDPREHHRVTYPTQAAAEAWILASC